MYDVYDVSTGTDKVERKAARYRLAKLLTMEHFDEAELLARQWLDQKVILPGDYSFVQEILEGARSMRRRVA